jgi:hypothetical protein
MDKTMIRRFSNIILPCIALAIILFYSFCGGACLYLNGSVLGIDLKYLGMTYGTLLILLAGWRKEFLLFLLLSAGVGAEIFLFSFQVRHGVYCPYCLAFGITIVLQFALNVERNRLVIAAACIVAGFFVTLLLFRGTAGPEYKISRNGTDGMASVPAAIGPVSYVSLKIRDSIVSPNPGVPDLALSQHSFL